MEKNSPVENIEVLDFSLDTPYFKALYHAPVPVTISCDDGQLLLVNHAFQQATGYTPEMIPTIGAWADLQQGIGDNVQERFNAYFDLGNTLTPTQICVKTIDGNILTWQVFNSPLGKTSAGQRMILSIISDITTKTRYQQELEELNNRLESEVRKRTRALNTTIEALEHEIEERKQISEALDMSRERLKNLSHRALTILEADRQSISKQLHDRLGASLAAIKFSLEGKELKQTQQSGKIETSLEPEILQLSAAIKETKSISAGLRPTTLDDLGLMATIKWYLRQFQRLCPQIRVNYSATVTEEAVPEKMKIIVYRIIQEGLSNVKDHSRASLVRLNLELTEDENKSIALSIEDNGRGFNVSETLSRKDAISGSGLTAMRERCEIFGDTFHIDAKAGRGTRIHILLPLFDESI